jgi:hypothetical protein
MKIPGRTVTRRWLEIFHDWCDVFIEWRNPDVVANLILHEETGGLPVSQLIFVTQQCCDRPEKRQHSGIPSFPRYFS